MSSLYLIRHGQASFDGPVYDVLSPLGMQQARMLGAYLGTRADLLPHAIYSGPRERQRHTAALLRETLAAPQMPMEVLEGLDEYPAEAVVRASLPQLRAEHPDIARQFSPASGPAADPLRDRRVFEHVFRLAMGRWLAGQVEHPEVESFATFAARVRGALRQVMAQEGQRRRVAVVTSAGPVAVAVQLALGMADAATLRLSWVVANASLTELRYRSKDPHGEVGLISFNAVPHLPDPAQLSYR